MTGTSGNRDQRTGQLVATKASVEFISAGKGKGDSDLRNYTLSAAAHLPLPLALLPRPVQFKSLVTTRN